jgi:protocatechuate 3,4-dioxygenase beta subunit
MDEGRRGPWHIACTSSGRSVAHDSSHDVTHRGRRTHRVLAVLGVTVLGCVATLGRPAQAPAPEPASEAAPPAPTLGIVSPPRRVAPVEPAVQAPLAGWLIDGLGQPVAEARVRVREADGTMRPVVAGSGADGAFHLDLAGDDRRVTLVIDGDPVFPAEVRWQGAGPARIMVARKLELEARVLDDGRPVEGAEVHLSDGSAPVLATAVTDAGGVARFGELPPGPYELWARAGNRATPLLRTVADEASAGAPLALPLQPAGAVEVTVTDDRGAPVEAAVTLVPADVDHAVREVATSAEGVAAVDAVRPGRWRVEVEADGYIPDTETIVRVREDRATLAVRLRPAGVVSGTVVDGDGRPVAGATLVLRGQGDGMRSHAETVARGLGVAAGHIRWIHPLAGTRHMPIRDTRRFGAGRPGQRPAECGQGHCGVDLGTERGMVVHAAADGVVAHVIRWLHEEAGRYVVVEHASGLRTHYLHLDDIRSDLEPGQTVRAGDPLGTLGRTGVHVSGPHLHFAISQERGTRTWYIDPEPILQHAVVLPAPRSLEPETTEVLIAALRGQDAAVPAGAAPPVRFTTDDQGRFRIDGVTPGRYVAAAFHEDLAPGASDAFTVRTGDEVAGVTIALSVGVVVHGQVRASGAPVGGARVLAHVGAGDSSRRVARTVTDADGRYELRALSGKVIVSVSADGHGALERTLTLADAGPARLAEDFDLAVEDATLHGQVLDDGGFPVAGAVLRVIEGPSLRRRVTADPYGNFAIGSVAAGDYVVELSSPAHPKKRATLGTGTFTKLTLADGGELRLRLRDRQTGQPLANVTVAARGPGDQARTLRTGPDGTVTAGPLATGRWQLRARTAGYVALEQSVAVVTGTPDEHTVELERGATVAGTVRDHNGQRVAGARVSIGRVSARSDQDGNFRLTDAPTGAIGVRAEKDGRTGTLPLELAPGDEFVTLQVDLPE